MEIPEEFDFEAHKRDLNQSGNWSFIVPVTGVKLTNEVDNEFRIKHVLLIDKGKLPHIRRRLGIPQRISELREQRWYEEFFDGAETFAVIRHTGTPDETKSYCRRAVADELSILALSQLGYSKRRYGSYPAIKGQPRSVTFTDVLINTKDKRRMLEGRAVGKLHTMILDRRWKTFQQKGFFSKLLEVLNGEVKVSREWRDDLERAAILAGQSQCSVNIAQSFLWNMIAIELLLTQQGDKYSDLLPKRLQAFLGWVGFWQDENYPARITEAYRKRSAFVHDGNRESITVQDLLFTDDLFLNLFLNLLHHINLFPSKQAIVDFAQKVEAEHILGAKPKIRPKTLRFISRSYSEEDLQEI